MEGTTAPKLRLLGDLQCTTGEGVGDYYREKKYRENSYIFKTITETRTEFNDYEVSVWVI